MHKELTLLGLKSSQFPEVVLRLGFELVGTFGIEKLNVLPSDSPVVMNCGNIQGAVCFE